MKKAALMMVIILLCMSMVTAQSITVQKPNGGEKWKLGESKQIQWTASGVSGGMRVVLLKNGAKVGNIADSIPFVPGTSDYTFNWTVGNYVGGTAVAGKKYRVAVREIGQAVGDQSNQDFEILNADGTSGGPKLKPGALAGLAEIKVTSPNANSYWDCGNTYTIRWETPIKQAFKIELYKYNKKTKMDQIAIMLLMPNKEYDGKYSVNWNIPLDYAHAPGRRAIKISTNNGVASGFSSVFSVRKSIFGEEQTVVLNPDDMQSPGKGHAEQYSTSPASVPSADNQGFGKKSGQMRVGYAVHYGESELYGKWYWWYWIFRASTHFNLAPYTGDDYFLVKATLRLKRESTNSTTGANHCALGLWQLTAPWTDVMSATAEHILNVNQMGTVWNLDVTKQVREWVQGMRDNHGFLLTGVNESPGKVSEHCVSYFTATLELVYREKNN